MNILFSFHSIKLELNIDFDYIMFLFLHFTVHNCNVICCMAQYPVRREIETFVICCFFKRQTEDWISLPLLNHFCVTHTHTRMLEIFIEDCSECLDRTSWKITNGNSPTNWLNNWHGALKEVHGLIKGISNIHKIVSLY